jgi:hypothetical protein
MRKYLSLLLILVAITCLFLYRLWDCYEYPESYEIGGFEYIAQPDGITCGPTSALMVLKRYGHNPTLDEVKSHTKTKWFSYNGKDIGMTSPDYVAIALRHYGVHAKLKRGDMTMLKHYISSDKPCIVLLRSSSVTWHYVVVIGYDDSKIVLADPGGGVRWEIPVDHFKMAWSFTGDMEGNLTTLACPICKGSGKWNSFDLGLLSICDICGGSGRQPDYLTGILKLADVYSYTIIVPSESVPTNSVDGHK